MEKFQAARESYVLLIQGLVTIWGGCEAVMDGFGNSILEEGRI